MTVFIVQKSMKFDDATGEFSPKFPGIEKASKWGVLRYLLGPTASPFNPSSVLAEMSEKLSSFCDDDFLVLVGNPALIGAATAIAANRNSGRVRCLQWSGRQSDYAPIFFTLW